MSTGNLEINGQTRQAQGPWADLALHTLGWKAFQDLSAHICEEILRRPVEIYREALDGGQDAAFFSRVRLSSTETLEGTVQCKFTSEPRRSFKLSDATDEEDNIKRLVLEGHADFYARALKMGLLPDENGEPMSERLRNALVEDLDTSFLEAD